MNEYPRTYQELMQMIEARPVEAGRLYFLDASVLLRDTQAPRNLARFLSAIANGGEAVVFCGVAVARGRAKALQPLKPIADLNWFIHEIQSFVSPPFKGFECNCIQLLDGNIVLRFDIAVANNQPHMFADSRFYKYYRRRCEMLTEAELRMLYKASASPELDFVGIYNTNGLPVLADGSVKTISFYPKLLIQNRGGAIEKDYKIEVLLPTVLHDIEFYPLQAKLVRHEGIYSVFSVAGNHALYQDEVAQPLEIKILVDTENFDVFSREMLTIRIYYSSGVQTRSLKLSDTLTYNGRILQKNDFVGKKPLRQNSLFSE